MGMTDFYLPPNNYPGRGKSQAAMIIAKYEIMQGKKILFAFNDLRYGVSVLHKEFPTALFEIIGNVGLIVRQRKPK